MPSGRVVLLRSTPGGTGVLVYPHSHEAADGGILMTQYANASVGTAALVALPDPYGDGTSRATYTVADVRGRQLTLQSSLPCSGADIPSGVPCVVSWVERARGATREAIVVASTASALIVDVAPERRSHPRYRRTCPVRLQVPYSPLGVLDAVAVDISAGGMRVSTRVALPPDARVFVTIIPAAVPPVLDLAEVRGPRRGERPTEHIASLKFTLIAPSHAARLAALLQSPAGEHDQDPVQPEVVGAAT
jgi:hypothetical protein